MPENIQGEHGNSNRRSLLARLALAGVFLAAVAVTSVWVIRSFVMQPVRTVILPPDALPAPLVQQSRQGGNGRPAARAHTGPPIGGFVVNERGEPISGVSVNLGWSEPADPNGPFGGGMAYQSASVKTDSKGHWSSRVPRAALGGLNLNVRDKDYVPATAQGSSKELLAQSFKMILTHGVDVSGEVADAKGQPIVGAQVFLGSNGMRDRDLNSKTDAAGKFTLHHVQADQGTAVTATYSGLAPVAQLITPSVQMERIRLVMTAGRTISGQVVDKAGKPLAGVRVELSQWQNNWQPVDLHATTGAKGNYHLRHAPDDAFQIQAEKDQYNADSKEVATGKATGDATGEATVNFILSPLITIRGKVIDAVTQKPIDRFKVVTGVRWSADQDPNFQDYTAKVFSNGQYRRTLSGFGGTIDAWYIRIEAAGYQPAISRPLQDSGTEDFALVHGQDLAGRVLAPDGKPAADAQVTVVGPGQQAYVNNGQFLNQGQSMNVTDATGHFDLPQQMGRFLVAAVSPDGFGQADQDALAKSRDVHLVAWGHVQGTLMIGAKPGVNETVAIQPANQRYEPNVPHVYHQLQATTDSAGHFSFDLVPAGDFEISRIIMIPIGANSTVWNLTVGRSLNVRPGATVTVNLGGTGRPVTGRIALPPALAGEHDWHFSGTASNVTVFVAAQMPDSVRRGSQFVRTLWAKAFLLTDAGKAFMAKVHASQLIHREYAASVAADGTFRIEDVLPGDYQFHGSAIGATDNMTLNSASVQFTVPEIPGGRSDQALDIGTFVIIKPQP